MNTNQFALGAGSTVMSDEVCKSRDEHRHEAAPFLRLAKVAAPAALITLGLYALMNALIAVKDYSPPSKIERVLKTITPEMEPSGPEIEGRSPPEPIEAITPPSPPKLGNPKGDIKLPPVDLSGSAPEGFGAIKFGDLIGPPPSIGNRDLVVVRPPVPSYPQSLASRGVQGSCDVRFSVDTRGRPFGISAQCTDAGFVRAAEQAVSKSEFAPKIVNDRAVERRNVVFPIDFSMD